MATLLSLLDGAVTPTNLPTKADQYHSDDTQSTAPESELDDESLEAEKPDSNQSKSPKQSFREEQRGVWTLYYPIPTTSSSPFLGLSFQWNKSAVPDTFHVWWHFIGEVFSLGPLAVTAYLATWAISGVFPSFRLKSESNLMSLAERVLAGRIQREVAITEFRRIAIEFIVIRVLAWFISALKEHSSSVVEQRVSLHFEKQLLSVQSRLELGPARDPDIEARIERVTGYTSQAWSTLSKFVDILSAISEVMALGSILRSQLLSPDNSILVGMWTLAYPLLSELRGLKKDKVFYARVTNHSWLRMQAFSQIGRRSYYKKEILSSGLSDYINNQYALALSNLGDLSTKNPAWSSENRWFGFERLEELLDAFPLLFHTWSAVHDPSMFSLAAMLKMQQTSGIVRSALWGLFYELKDVSDLVNDINALYEILALKSGIEDGHISYPNEAHIEQKGMSVEFKSVTFGYPSTSKKVLNNLSFKIEPGQLCVIVGENGCGKSTTINLINRLYDCDSGEIHIDNRPIRDYKVSTLRSAVNVMYQSYRYFPLTIKENLLMGDAGNADPDVDLENATKLGGAYDFIQKLPLKFETNLEPVRDGWASSNCTEEDRKKFKCLEDKDEDIDLSGGQWQRLAISRSFMKNSVNTRLLCYDEPSASLDPKAEAAVFERLRKLRGEKTMIFVTHRFGYLTKHADLIIYINEGSVIEQGTHKSLLAEDGEYAKMYKIQSEAFAE